LEELTMTEKRTGRVLIVEDEEALVRILEFMLRARGYEVLSAYDGADGLSLATSAQPDLVVLDIMLPRMDGVTVCRRLKGDARTRHIPIILLTARAQSEDRENGLDAGANLFLTKPYERSTLLASIDRLVEEHRRGTRAA
jgi:DNA-binding response OmpR family regulator